MTHSVLEHVNITVRDAKKTAQQLCDLFGWKIRWHGPSLAGGTTYHVGEENSYLAIYTKGTPKAPCGPSNEMVRGLNHVGIVVDDLDVTESRVIEMGFTTTSHGVYEPGRRFYFEDQDEIEFEIVSYAKPKSPPSDGFKKVMAEMAMAGIARK